MKKLPHFKAMLTYYQPENGGRTTPVSSGFRASIKFPFESQLYIGIQTFSETELVFAGDTVNAEITLVGAEPFLEKLYEGMDFEFSDHSNTIGNGVITTVYPR